MQVRVEQEATQSIVILDGDIDEGIDSLGPALAKLSTKRWVFDCANVRKINSMGTSQWITLFKGTPGDVELWFRKCPLAFVDMAVMVPSFLTRGRVESLFVPYHCSDCSFEEQNLHELAGSQPVADSRPCPKCGGSMAADEDVHDDLDALSEMGAA